MPRRPPAPLDASEQPKRVRLQRALAAAGYGSRRQCEELILEGRVEVDGQVIDQLGVSIDPHASKVFVDGTALKPQRLVYFIVNKPVGVVTTNADPEGRPRVIDLVPPDERVFPVGRLDRASEGLILLTNDGELAQRLAHPRYEVPKVYRVVVAGNVDHEAMREMRKGIYIAEGLVRVEGAKVLKARAKSTELEITLKEGKNREIRRILARLGHKVQTLKRIGMGPLRLGEMPTGAYRRLTAEEVKRLKRVGEAESGSTESGGEPAPRRGKPTRPSKPRSSTSSKAKPGAAKEEANSRAGKATRSQRPENRDGSSIPRTPKSPGTRRQAGRAQNQVRSQQAPQRPDFLPVSEAGSRSGAVIGADTSSPKPRGKQRSDATLDEETNRVVRPRTRGKAAGRGGKPRPAGGAGRGKGQGKASRRTGKPTGKAAQPDRTGGATTARPKPPKGGKPPRAGRPPSAGGGAARPGKRPAGKRPTGKPRRRPESSDEA